jgi:serine/threonine-protein kinase
MLHSAALLGFFGLTNWLALRGVSERWPYVLIFTVGLGAWAALFWTLRRRGGPITFAERLLAHVWGMGVLSINLTFLVEWLLGLPVLTLAPMLAVTNGGLFLIKGGILSGAFYLQAAAVFLAIVPMAWYPRWAPMIFGVVAGACFFITGLRAYLKRVRTRRVECRPGEV